jgi:hypothetical protein
MIIDGPKSGLVSAQQRRINAMSINEFFDNVLRAKLKESRMVLGFNGFFRSRISQGLERSN